MTTGRVEFLSEETDAVRQVAHQLRSATDNVCVHCGESKYAMRFAYFVSALNFNDAAEIRLADKDGEVKWYDACGRHPF